MVVKIINEKHLLVKMLDKKMPAWLVLLNDGGKLRIVIYKGQKFEV
jgi:hypothetical protein